jgi:hypothetical protein
MYKNKKAQKITAKSKKIAVSPEREGTVITAQVPE